MNLISRTFSRTKEQKFIFFLTGETCESEGVCDKPHEDCHDTTTAGPVCFCEFGYSYNANRDCEPDGKNCTEINLKHVPTSTNAYKNDEVENRPHKKSGTLLNVIERILDAKYSFRHTVRGFCTSTKIKKY